MVHYKCVVFESCSTGNTVNVRLFANSEALIYFEGIIGNIVEINDPILFPDTVYTVSSVCSLFQEGCGCDLSIEYIDGSELLKITELSELEACPTDAYVLVNCNAGNITINDPADLIQSPSTVLVTSTDLALYVGSVITIEEYPNNCYTVFGPYSENTGCPCDALTLKMAYKDCECCIPDLPKKYQPRILDPVKIFYRILQDQCDINANIKFANAYYKIFKHEAYGMGICCDTIDFEKVWLKKELSDLNQIYDPSACVVPEAPAEPLVCEGPDATQCQLPTSVNGQIIY